MESGKISKALRCLSDAAKCGVLSKFDKVTIKGKNWTVLDLLQEKHPCSRKDLKIIGIRSKKSGFAVPSSYFLKIIGSEIRRAAMETNGSCGPSGLDAGEWRHHKKPPQSVFANQCQILRSESPSKN